MGLVVYGHHLSQPARSVFVFCKVNNIEYEEKIVDFSTGEHKKEPFKSINPRCQMPVIRDDDFILSESMTIMKYLARKHKVDSHWYPEDLKTQARVNKYLDWHHTGLRKAGRSVMFDLMFIPAATGKPIDKEQLGKDTEQFDSTLGMMEVFLGDKQFLASDEISIADIVALCEMTQVFATREDDMLSKHPKLRAWRGRVEEKLNPHFAHFHKAVYDFMKQFHKI